MTRPPVSALYLLSAFVLVTALMGCGVNPSPTPVPTAPPSPTAFQPTPTTISPAATPVATVGVAPAPQLKTETLHVTTMIAIDDLEPMIQDLQDLAGVQGAQGSGQDIQIMYNPDQVGRDQIIAVIENHGYHVQEP